eukprot:3044608-Ditylum_brightwellii.AAC.1
MIPEVTALHLQSLGLPSEAIKCSVLLNHNTTHYIKTSNGILNDHYKHTSEYGKVGEGQGKASSPSNWLFQLSTILNTLHALVSGIFLISICQKFTVKCTAEAYVDDTDCTYIDQTNQNEPPAQIRQKIQHIAQTWENLLYSTGGELSLKKTHWWLRTWIWEGGKAHLATREECPETMKITVGCSNSPSTAQRKEVNDSVKKLRVMANPAGDFSQELERRKDYSTQMATRIRTLCMKPKNTFCLYRNIWLPACQYTLAVTSFTEAECLSIMKPSVYAILPKL